MIKKIITGVLIHLPALAYFYVLSISVNGIPSMGPLLSPFSGFWQNAEPYHTPEPNTITLQYDDQEVKILLDSILVPTIESKSYWALFYAQGYITAMHRLWQMELQTRASAGRLSEIFGSRTEEYDVLMRRLGMAKAADNALDSMMHDDTTRRVLEAYTAGVNAWIKTLKPSQYPLEYKILGHKPELWEPKKCANLLKYMAFDLSFNTDDAGLNSIKQRLGEAAAELLFPDYPYLDNPIVKNPDLDFEPVALNGPSTALPIRQVPIYSSPGKESSLGSNNWAVTRSRTATGYALLANDPHLNLTLPSIWYACKMKLKNGFKVAGATLPGAPGIIIGYNEHISWGVTNGYADVVDWYVVDTSGRYAKTSGMGQYIYHIDEIIRIKGKGERHEIVPYTAQGPVVAMHQQSVYRKDIPIGMACRWTAHDPSNELKAFLQINQACTINDFTKALHHYSCPAQNFIFADAQGNIAIFPNTGKIPTRSKGFGKYVHDISDPQHQWQHFIPRSHLPKIINPANDYVYSANQSTTTPQYPYYLGTDFGAPDRAFRIDSLLQNTRNATVDSMRLMQMDDYNHFASIILPYMLQALHNAQVSLTAREQQIISTLKTWDYRQTASSYAGAFFQTWWNAFNDSLWYPILGKGLPYPKRYNTAYLLKNKANELERLLKLDSYAIANTCFKTFKAADQKLNEFSLTKQQNPTWSLVKNTHIDHVGRIPGLGTGYIETGGSKNSINAMSERSGPSWRMVVQMAPGQTCAWMVYPGGQSGNPGSRFYDNWLPIWQQGHLNTFTLPK